jgi:tetratricopeptide (TPR) repeat protein
MSGNTTRSMDGPRGEPGVSRRDPPRVLGRYVLLEEVGSGGAGLVYRAYDPLLERPIAIKLLRARAADDGLRNRAVLREGRAIAQISHANVVAVHDVGTHGDDVFVAMEFLEGLTLRGWLAERHSLREVLDVFEQAARGLAAAHERGIVHRDFKPENVFVTHAGRVVVADFGLARATDGGDDEPGNAPSPASPSWDVRITHTGAAPGTPGYMAPEQLRGDPIDARVDQFAWCVALWEGLYGERPFPRGEPLRELRAIEQGPTRPARPRYAVPGWLEALLRRGLAADPEQRFASMREVIAALARHQRRRQTLGWSLASVGLLALLSAGSYVLWGGPSPCPRAVDQLSGTWDASLRSRLETRLAASGSPVAAEATRVVVDRLAHYSRAWLDSQQAVCEATHVRHAQSEAALDLRMECLMRRRSALSALVHELAGLSGRDAPQRAVESLGRLEPLAGCDDLRALSASFPPIQDVKRRSEADAMNRELARAHAVAATGNNAKARTLIDALLPRARTLGYAPLSAEVLLEQGRILYDLGLFKEAWTVLEEAASVAGKARRDDVQGAALTYLLLSCSYVHEDSRCLQMLPLVAPTIEHLRAGDPVRFEFLAAAARLNMLDRNLDLALSFADRAEQAAGDDQARRAQVQFERLRILRMYRDRSSEAWRTGTQALATTERAFGPSHPMVGDILIERGLVASLDGRYGPARSDLERAVKVLEQTQPPGHRRFARAWLYLGQVAWREGRHDEALDLFHKARAVYIGEGGPSLEPVRFVDKEIANVMFVSGRLDEARAAYQRLLDEAQSAAEPELVMLAELQAALCEVSVFLKEPERARGECTRALELNERSPHPDPSLRAFAKDLLGRALLALGQTDRAVQLLRAALDARQDRGSPVTLACNRYYLARALWTKGAQRDQALADARSALADIESHARSDLTLGSLVGEARAWLATASLTQRAAP